MVELEYFRARLLAGPSSAAQFLVDFEFHGSSSFNGFEDFDTGVRGKQAVSKPILDLYAYPQS
jgi:hypothetical protein